MKLVTEVIKLPSCLLVILAIITEFIILVYIETHYKSGYSVLFEPTNEIALIKTNMTLIKFNEILSDGIYRYLADLKTIGKHMSTFVLEGESNDKSINKNSKFYKNYENSTNKNIFYSDFETLSSVDFLKNFTNDYHFDYIKKYEEEFLDLNNPNNIIHNLLDNEMHPELNTISYYKFNGNINSLSSLSRTSANYLISILKTIYIKRFLTKRELMEYLHFNLMLEDEFYVFPPDSYNNTFLYKFPNFANTTCNYGSKKKETEFPNCIYNYIKLKDNKLISFSYPYNEQFFLQTYIEFNFIVINLCLTIPFVKYPDFKSHSYLPHICIELNFTKLFDFATFKNKEKLKIGVFARNSFLKNDLLPVFYSNAEAYELIKEVFSDDKFGNFKIYTTNNNRNFFSLFHFLYLDIFANESCYNQENFNINEIFEEYNNISSEFLKRTNDINILNYNSTTKYFEIEKTGCRRNLYNENVTVSKDNNLIVLSPLIGRFGLLDENFFEIINTVVNYPILYSFAIISTNQKGNEEMFNNIVQIKILRLFCFFFLSTLIILLLAIILIRIFSENKFEPINTLINLSENIEDFCNNNKLRMENINVITNSIEQNSKEALILKNIFQNMFKTLLLKKIIEEKKIINLDEKNADEKNNLIIQNLYEMIQNMNNEETKNVCKWIISHYHYINGYYKLAEEELKSLVIDITNKESNLYSKNDIYDSQLKDKIGRFNKMAFLNEYTPLKINETLLPIIRTKLIKQKVKYLYGLSKYNQGVIINNNINNAKNKTVNKNKNPIKNNYEKFYEAIECFNECKDISKLLGMNPIKHIYSHIMIAQCYIKMKIYKEAMINLNEALILYIELQKIFKDEENELFCPRVMLYIESFIFQTIMFNIVQAVRISSKENACGWLILKIFETSPFIFPNIHGECSNIIQNCLKYPDKNNRYKDKFKKIFNKISARIVVRKSKNKNNSNMNDTRTNFNSSNAGSSSHPSSSIKGYINHLRNSSRSIDFTIKGISSFVTHKKENYYKNKCIILCVSEKIVPKLNGMEIKDVLMKFFQKCFINNDNDKFGFIQFSNNGKKTITIKPQRLEGFLQKLESNKNAFQFSESINYKKEVYFTEFYNLFDSIIKQQTSKCDYIIIMFINSEDIRFNSIKECVEIVNSLNENNYTVILLSNDREINKEKILSINSFIYGLYDGHFIQINNYQRIKQILVNFATNNKNDKFVNYDYEFLENIL